MNYNPTAQTTFNFVDIPNKMMILQDRWGGHNKGDALGRSKLAYFLYGDPQFIEGAKNCWKRIDCDPDNKNCRKRPYYYQGYRYPTPEYYAKDMSRDHTTNTLCLLKMANDPFLDELANNVRWLIAESHKTSDGKVMKHRFTPAMWGWMKGLTGKKWGLSLFYFMSFIEAILYIIINNLCYLLGWISREVHQDDYDQTKMKRQLLSKWRHFWAGLTYPVYALQLYAWQLHVLKDNPIKRLLQLMAYPIIGRHHYLHKLMFNVGKVSKADVLGYKSMKGGRWTTPLNEINDRNVFILEREDWLEANVIDQDILIKFWNIRNPDDKIIT